MTRRWMAMGVVLTATVAWAQQGPVRADLTVEEAHLAGQALLQSAYDLYLLPDEALRGPRLMLTAEMASRVDPSNVQIAEALGNLYAYREEWGAAAAQYRRGLDYQSDDYDLWLTWLGAITNARQTANERLAALDAAARDTTIPEPVRAEALVRYAQLLLTQARDEEAQEVFLAAMQFDPYSRSALQGWLATRDSTQTVDQANVMMRMLRACPRDYVVAREMASLLGSVGLWRQSVEYYDYAWTLRSRQLGEEIPPYAWAVDYCNAMIDAGQLARALDMFMPILHEYDGALELRSLLIEAASGLNRPRDVRQLVQEVEVTYGRQGESQSAGYDAEMAMFYLVVHPNARRALQYARMAMADLSEEQARDPLLQRLLGGAELLAGSEDTGRERLEAIANVDIYAAVFLADYYYRSGQTDAGSATILMGARLGRSGPAFRRLEALAREHGVEIPTMEGAAGIHRMVSANANYVQMGLEPELFLSVRFVPVERPFAMGEPIVVDIELANIGPLPIPTGAEGLFDPQVAVSVTLDDGEMAPITVTDLPVLSWASPHYLAPGETLVTEVRLDLGRLGKALDDRLFDSVTLHIEGTLDPLTGGDTMQSALPTVELAPLSVTRQGFAVVDPAAEDSRVILAAYEAAMANLEARASSGDLVTRLLAARQVGRVQGGLFNSQVDPSILPVTGLPIASMLQSLGEIQEHLLADPSPAVRAAMVRSIRYENEDDRRSAVATAFGDDCPLVRFQVAEILLNLRGSATEAMLEQYAREGNDPSVVELAELILDHHEVLAAAEERDDVAEEPETMLPEDGYDDIDEEGVSPDSADDGGDEANDDESNATP